MKACVPTVIIHEASLRYGDHVIFSNLNLTLPSCQWVALMGASGVGKSSLLKMVGGLIPAAHIGGRILADNDLPLIEQIAYMPQADLLFPWLTVLQNVLIGSKLQARNHKKSVYQQQASTLLAQVGLADVTHFYPYQLSGGMRQRVALARTLMQDKPIILMDEPFSALDAITRYQLQELAAALLQSKTVLFITHDVQEALRLAHQIYLMPSPTASLKLIANLKTPTPRLINDEDLLSMQPKVWQALAEVSK